MRSQGLPDSKAGPFGQLKLVKKLADITLLHAGVDGPPAGKILRLIATIQDRSDGAAFMGSTLVDLWDRDDREAAHWRDPVVQHVRSRIHDLVADVNALRRLLLERPFSETVPTELHQAWKEISAALPTIREMVRPTKAVTDSQPMVVPECLAYTDQVPTATSGAGVSLREQFRQLRRWAQREKTKVSKKGPEPPVEPAEELARRWAKAIVRDWKLRRPVFKEIVNGVPNAERPGHVEALKRRAILDVLAEAVLQADQFQRVKVGRSYIRRTSRLDEDSRDILIVPRKDLPDALLILWVKNHIIRLALLQLDPEPEHRKRKSRTEPDKLAPVKDDGGGGPEDLSTGADDSLALAAHLGPFLRHLTPAQQLLLREWINLPYAQRTLREAARRVPMSYQNAKVQWGKTWKTLAKQGLRRPHLPLPQG